jgi:uncharacterized damage-inducible protein DinB
MTDDWTPAAPGGLAAANLHLIEQGTALLAGLDLGLYSAPPPVPMGTIGGHFRHCLEFYERFLAGLDAGAIDYDARKRDPRVERDPGHARSRLLAAAAGLRGLPAVLADHPLAVIDDSDDNGATVPGRSTVRRELSFLASHTTHHYALIAALLRLRGVEPGAGFGVAASTLAHHRRARLAAAARP